MIGARLPFWAQLGSFWGSSGSIFGRFWHSTRPRDPQKSSHRCSESTIFKKTIFEVDIDFWYNFGANMVSFWLPKSAQSVSKIYSKMHQFLDRFWYRIFKDSGNIFEPNLGPCWAVLGPKLASEKLVPNSYFCKPGFAKCTACPPLHAGCLLGGRLRGRSPTGDPATEHQLGCCRERSAAK